MVKAKREKGLFFYDRLLSTELFVPQLTELTWVLPIFFASVPLFLCLIFHCCLSRPLMSEGRRKTKSLK